LCSSGPSSKLIISSGIEFLGSGAKHELEIPLSEFSYEELSDDIKRMIQQENKKIH
jgi:hypothetical protein